jgi:hypothetical protein
MWTWRGEQSGVWVLGNDLMEKDWEF